MKDVLVYVGEKTIHPELGLLDPENPRELAAREKPAIEAAAAAGLPVAIVTLEDDEDLANAVFTTAALEPGVPMAPMAEPTPRLDPGQIRDARIEPITEATPRARRARSKEE